MQFQQVSSSVYQSTNTKDLLNYPTKVQFSGYAIRKMDAEYNENDNSSTIVVYANLKSGKKVSLFSINSNFFGRVQRDRETKKPFIEYDVSHYSDPVKAIQDVCTTVHMLKDLPFDKMMSMIKPVAERSLGDEEMETIDPEDIVTFGARYLLGYAFASETHEFSIKYFEEKRITQNLVLEIGLTRKGDWDLAIWQRKPFQENVTNSDKMVLSQVEKEVPKHFTCPISLIIMQDPVIGTDGNSYERIEIEQWLEKHSTSPLTNEPMAKMLIPNRQLKEAIASYNNS